MTVTMNVEPKVHFCCCRRANHPATCAVHAGISGRGAGSGARRPLPRFLSFNLVLVVGRYGDSGEQVIVVEIHSFFPNPFIQHVGRWSLALCSSPFSHFPEGQIDTNIVTRGGFDSHRLHPPTPIHIQTRATQIPKDVFAYLSHHKMFGCCVAGRPLQTNIQTIDDTHAIFELPHASSVNHVCVFLLGNGA